MKLLNWIKAIGVGLLVFFGLYPDKKQTGAFGRLNDTAKIFVPIAVNIVEALKSFLSSDTSGVIAAIIKKAIPGVKDDVLVDKITAWLKIELPRLSIKLHLVNTAINIKNNEDKIQAIIDMLKLSENKGTLALEFATSLSYYLMDGKLTKEELKAASDDFYNKFVKK